MLDGTITSIVSQAVSSKTNYFLENSYQDQSIIINIWTSIADEKKDRDVIKILIDAAKRYSRSEDAPYNSSEVLFNRTDNYRTVIDLAMRVNHLDVVELILVEDPAYQHGRTSKNINLKPLIYVAAEHYYKNMLKLLSERNSLGHRGQTALKSAIPERDEGTLTN